ncbi:prephenate dehydratase [Mycobacterium deserti]|uniref:Prephenate dehydratase n=1 Tax=Mycobacterium deserti TaxID=2978347 RepID=A0ABT2MGZ4_9MYCO|nr:prephenate dehydratase [Mycobacterium deserti]MCT7661559.1 prephenate dehydratase [Mycobacterium deserti]
MPRIAYLGPEGTFSEAALRAMAAARRLPVDDFEPLPTDSPPAAVELVRAGEATYACVPIENSINGSVLPTLDSLATGSEVQIFAEYTLDIAFTIAVRPGVTEPASIAAYPVARAQVANWVAQHLPLATFQAADSNAAAAVDVAAGRADAAVTTALAADRHGLATLADGVVDEANARTRFVLVGPPGPPPQRTGADRTSVVLRLANVPGALAAALTEFAIRDVDLTRIESRPTRTELGTYIFFLDFAGHVQDDPVAQALEALYRRCVDVRNLGSWPTGSAKLTRPLKRTP